MDAHIEDGQLVNDAGQELIARACPAGTNCPSLHEPDLEAFENGEIRPSCSTTIHKGKWILRPRSHENGEPCSYCSGDVSHADFGAQSDGQRFSAKLRHMTPREFDSIVGIEDSWATESWHAKHDPEVSG